MIMIDNNKILELAFIRSFYFIYLNIRLIFLWIK